MKVLQSLRNQYVAWRRKSKVSAPESFPTPKDFVEYLKVVYANPVVPGNLPSDEFMSITLKQLKDFGHSSQDPMHYTQLIIDSIVKDINSFLPPEIVSKINTSVAIGSIQTGEVNATCVRSADNKYAILINHGLLTLMNKFLKLTLVVYRPEHITYCNRKNAKDVTTSDVRKYMDELISNYKRYGAPYGAMIKVSPSMMGQHGTMIWLNELFIVCHELGHFLNGDLEVSTNFVEHPTYSGVHVFSEYSEREIEFNADLTGYDLFRQIIEKQSPNLSQQTIVGSIVSVFNLFYLISRGSWRKPIWKMSTSRSEWNSSSQTHPHPMERTLNIVNHYYSAELENLIGDSYEDPRSLIRFFAALEKH